MSKKKVKKSKITNKMKRIRELQDMVYKHSLEKVRDNARLFYPWNLMDNRIDIPFLNKEKAPHHQTIVCFAYLKDVLYNIAHNPSFIPIDLKTVFHRLYDTLEETDLLRNINSYIINSHDSSINKCIILWIPSIIETNYDYNYHVLYVILRDGVDIKEYLTDVEQYIASSNSVIKADEREFLSIVDDMRDIIPDMTSDEVFAEFTIRLVKLLQVPSPIIKSTKPTFTRDADVISHFNQTIRDSVSKHLIFDPLNTCATQYHAVGLDVSIIP